MEPNASRTLEERIDAVLAGYDGDLDKVLARRLVTVTCLTHRMDLALGDLNAPAEPGVQLAVDGEHVVMSFDTVEQYDKFVCWIEDLRKGRQ